MENDMSVALACVRSIYRFDLFRHDSIQRRDSCRKRIKDWMAYLLITVKIIVRWQHQGFQVFSVEVSRARSRFAPSSFNASLHQKKFEN